MERLRQLSARVVPPEPSPRHPISDEAQIKKIKAEAETMTELYSKLKFWDYVQVLKVHESLEFVNDSINSLGLVPQSFK